MRLSEAMMLGSVTCKMIPYDLNSCALGSACNALGLPDKDSIDRWCEIERIWPWTCDYNHIFTDHISKECAGKSAIWKRFDNLVCEGKMTFEQLVDYVRSIEPECGECCEFECTCKPTEVTELEEVHAISGS